MPHYFLLAWGFLWGHMDTPTPQLITMQVLEQRTRGALLEPGETWMLGLLHMAFAPCMGLVF